MTVGNTSEGGQLEISESQLVEVQVKTTQRTHCVFPDVARATIERVLAENLAASTHVTLVNARGMALTIPISIIEAVHVDGSLRWKAP